MKLYVIFLFVLASLTTAANKQKRSTSRNLKWETSDLALEYLTTDMSDMEYFKSSLLPLLAVERVSGTSGNKEVQKHIKSFLKSWHIEERNFTATTPYGEKEFTNIVATFDQSKPTKIVLACHFDSKSIPNQIFIGATDSAVPCSILLETSRQLQCLLEKGPANDSVASDLTLQLIFFDGEEAFRDWTSTDSIYGARQLAKEYSVEPDPVNKNITKIESIRELILVDLLGTADATIPQLLMSTADLYQHLVKIEQYLRANNYLTSLHLGPIYSGQILNGGIEDDHIPFLQRGVDVLHLISYPFPSVWHQPSDDMAHLDYNFIDNYSRIFRVFISNLLHLDPENRSCRKK